VVASQLLNQSAAGPPGCPHRQQSSPGSGLQAGAHVPGQVVLSKLACLHSKLPQDVTGLLQGGGGPEVVSLASDSRQGRRNCWIGSVRGGGLVQIGHNPVHAR
jgi:hypothetical protein